MLWLCCPKRRAQPAAGTGMAAVPTGAVSGQLLHLWWVQSWERPGSSASGNHSSLVELAELQCPSCQLMPALPEILLRQGRCVCVPDISPGPAQVPSAIVALSTAVRFPWSRNPPCTPCWSAPLPMVLAWKLLISSLPKNSNSPKILVCLWDFCPLTFNIYWRLNRQYYVP